jgi:hypothetical protein
MMSEDSVISNCVFKELGQPLKWSGSGRLFIYTHIPVYHENQGSAVDIRVVNTGFDWNGYREITFYFKITLSLSIF